MLDPASFKQALRCFPSGVVIATALDEQDRPRGFTASSFAAVSLEPPLVLVCPAKSAECYRVFETAEWFSINLLRAADEPLARLFATRGAAKFVDGRFVSGAHGLPLLRTALATLVCRRFAQHDCGDHTVILGAVYSAELEDHGGEPAVYCHQRFWSITTASPQAPMSDTSAGALAGQ